MKLQRINLLKKLLSENGLDMTKPASDLKKAIDKIEDVKLKEKIILALCSSGLILPLDQ